ncbi:hypothetical protein Ancab_011827 [Ancistrocladus abbreviatus]
MTWDGRAICVQQSFIATFSVRAAKTSFAGFHHPVSLYPAVRPAASPDRMSAYDNVVSGKLKLKGKALDVKSGGIKKKKKLKKQYDDNSQVKENEKLEDLSTEANEESDKFTGEGKTPHYDDHLTAAERRYIEQREKLDVHRLAKTSNKSHRDRIQDFNQYLANMSEHYDIPKVGPG